MAANSCDGCPFLKRHGCKVPGGTCIYRAIGGVPGHYVGDVLQNVGAIPEGSWPDKKKKAK